MSVDDRPFAKFLRLHNGDDVIAEVIEVEDEEGILYTLFHPLKVIYSPSDSDGYMAIMFTPWVFPRICDQQEFVIHAEDVMLMADVSEKMNIYYWDSVDVYMEKSKSIEKQTEVHKDDDMTEEEDYELYNKIMEQLGNKRTFH